MNILMAGTNGDNKFWKAMSLLEEMSAKRVTVADRDSLFQALSTIPGPIMILVLSSFLSEMLTREEIMRIHEVYKAQIIVAGKFSTWRGELNARTAGIACYILLPDEAPSLAEQTRHLLNACRRRLENQPEGLCEKKIS
ncbi:hypothetical protein [Desulfonatronovibrio magnus]|uniref:hypothetical protein n=1 Tax=Desulfonatronovibrio magnus TaxID=698827 RepID=UPI0012FC2BEF|nr:hypothetical protein [Desulfonatronovibrio magnus]